MVQLKEPLCPCYTTELIVSIPYGTIKRKIEFAVGEVFQLFQLLMVQLKVLEQNTIADDVVSITYGTIKSWHGLRQYAVHCLVSIPYGTDEHHVL